MEQPKDFGDGTIVFMLGNADWHDGPGWYYFDSEYTDEGSVGAFETRDEAVEHARADGWTGRDSAPELPCEAP